MPQKKVRFTILAGEQESELFSVRETSQSDLIILFKKNEQFGTPAGEKFRDLAESRMTVHTSPNSPGFIINYHVGLSDGGTKLASTYIRPRHDTLRWPLISVLAPNLSLARYKTKPKANDESYSIGQYHPETGTLIYALIVGDKRHEFSIKEFNSRYYDFDQFRLYVFWIFSLLPSNHQGHVAVPSSAEISENGKKGKILNHDARTPRLRQIGEYMTGMINALADAHAKRVVRWLRSGGVDTSENFIADLDQLKVRFSKVPLPRLP